jgi:hypothetical protein
MAYFGTMLLLRESRVRDGTRGPGPEHPAMPEQPATGNYAMCATQIPNSSAGTSAGAG